MVIDLPDLEATHALGVSLGARLFEGAVIALEGGLGAGKTHLVRGIAEGVGVPDLRVVTSPTFVLIQEYHGRLPLYHFDAYRLPSPEAFLALGAAELLEGEGACVVEWADLVDSCLPAERLRIVLRVTGEHSRQAVMVAHGERHATLL